jgi:glycerol kinase
MSIDQGTTRTKATILDHDARIVSSAAQEMKRFYPQPGWIEQSPEEILSASLDVVREAFKNGRIAPDEIEAIGITNQSQTTMFWNKHTGEAVGRAISWQDMRTLSICEQLKATDREAIEARTGRRIMPNCAATKIRWLLEHDRAIQRGVARGELLYGTVDAWLTWHLTGRKHHITDLSNAGGTLLVNTHTLNYDDWMLNKLGIPYEILPQLRTSSEMYAYTDPRVFFDVRVPISSLCSDLTAAVYGKACFEPGSVQCNFGTGSSLMMNTGERLIAPAGGLYSFILWATGAGVVRGFGGWINVSGSALQWLRDELGLVRDDMEAEILANKVNDTAGVYFVPAFTGLSCPYEDSYARGSMFGITHTTTRAHIVRASLEAMVYQIRDAFDALKKETGIAPASMRAGGGNLNNAFHLQFLADILGIPVDQTTVSESSALGAAFLAGLGIGFWETEQELAGLSKIERQFVPYLSADKRESLYHGWRKAVGRAGGWLKD